MQVIELISSDSEISHLEIHKQKFGGYNNDEKHKTIEIYESLFFKISKIEALYVI